MFFSVNILEDTLRRIQIRLHSRVLPQLLSQTILVFGIGFEDLSDSTIILAYVNLLTLLSLAVFLFPQVRNPEDEKSITKDIWISLFAVYTVLASLFSLQDSNGVSLGFYCLGVQLIPLLILVYQYPKPAENCRMQVKNYKSSFIYLSLFQIPIKELLGAERVQEQRNCCLLWAVNSVIRFFFMLYGTINFVFFSSTCLDTFLLITLSIGFGITFSMFRLSILVLLNIFVYSKVINLKFKDRNGYQKQLERIPKKKNHLTVILIDYIYGDIQFYRYNECLSPSCDFQCELSIKLFEKLDQLQRQNVEILYHKIPAICEYHAYTLMANVQCFTERVLELFPNSYLTLFEDGGLWQLSDIMMRRYCKGFFCGSKENKINDILKENFYQFQIQLNPRERKSIFAQLISNTLQTFVLLKRVKRYLPLLSSSILIDLYERDDQNVLLSIEDSIFSF